MAVSASPEPHALRSWRAHAALLCLVSAAYFGGLFERAELGLMDLRMRLDQRPPRGELVLVEIDGASLRRLQVWPWPREWHAQALANLFAAGATEVAFDIDFSALSNERSDARLAEALRAAGRRVILAAFSQRPSADSPEVLQTLPQPAFAANSRVASVTVHPEIDSRVRRLARWEDGPELSLPSLSSALYGEATDGSRNSFYVDFGIRVAEIPRLSFIDVLDGTEALATVAGKRVLIGASAVELNDQLPVPVYRTLSGPEFVALGYESLAQGRTLQRTGRLPSLAVAAALALLLGPWFTRWTWRRGLLTVLGCHAVTHLAGHGLHSTAGISLDTMPWLVTPALSYALSIVLLIDSQAKRILLQRMAEARHNAMMQGIVDSSFDGIVTADGTGRISHFNAAAERLFGLGAGEAVGRHVDELIRLPSGSAAGALLAKLESPTAPVEVRGLRGGHPAFIGELALRRASLQSARGDQGDGGEDFWVLTVRDITERKAAEEAQAEARAAAETANRAKTEFLATMSHELRTPLNAVLGFAEIIRDEMLGPLGAPLYKDYAGDIHRSGEHLLEIINDILDTSKVEAGKLTLNEELVEIPAAIAAAVHLAEGRPESGRVPVRVRLHEPVPAIMADQRLLKQILLNLLSNALKFTPSGWIEVGARVAASGWLEITVRDSGIGIAEENIQKVLQPFMQVDSSHTRQYQGTGLGLSLVNSLMELHGGNLHIASRLGVGTTVTCRFPPERLEPSRAVA